MCVQVPCETLSHVNITMLMSKLESLREYAIREDIFDSLASPGHVSTLLQVMNDTFATIATHVSVHAYVLTCNPPSPLPLSIILQWFRLVKLEWRTSKAVLTF